MKHHLVKGWQIRWGLMVVGLGIWEAIAIFFRPQGQIKVKTITTTVRTSHTRWVWPTRILVLAWLVALGKHLLDNVEEQVHSLPGPFSP